MTTFEILSFARNNSLIATYLDDIMRVLPESKLHDSPEQDANHCKYAFINVESIGYTGQSTVARIAGNERHLHSEYFIRDNPDAKEYPVLTRYLDKSKVTAPAAKCVAVVLYTREQLALEKMIIDADFGVVTAQAEPIMGISPMTPATITRNALGIEFGGNGKPLDLPYLLLSVKYWSEWAIVR